MRERAIDHIPKLTGWVGGQRLNVQVKILVLEVCLYGDVAVTFNLISKLKSGFVLKRSEFLFQFAKRVHVTDKRVIVPLCPIS